MCYLCKAKVTNYDHFYGQGDHPTPEKTCQLWSDNEALHKQEVAAAAVKAKEELSLNSNLTRLLTVDVEQGKVIVGHGPGGG